MSVPATQVARLPARIRRRDGSETPFDSEKIANAIRRAGEATGEFGTDESRLLTAQVVKVLSHGHFGDGIPDIERIQDIVEQTLIAANHLATARAYISYRDQHKRLRDDRRTWSMSPARSTSISSAPTGGSAPMPTRATRWAG